MALFIKDIKKKNFLVIGDLFIEEYIIGTSSRLSPEAPVPIINVSSTYQVLGGAGNTASNLSSLGVKVKLIAPLGKDDNGEKIKELAKKNKLSLFPILTSTPTIKKTRIVSQNQQLMRVDFETLVSLNTIQEQKVFFLIKKNLLKIDVLILSDYNKGFLSEALCQKIISLCKDQNIIVVSDPKPMNGLFFKDADFITPNWKEAQELINKNNLSPSAKNVTEIAKLITKKFKTSVVITLGEGGLFFLSKEKKESFFLPTEAKEVFDVSGAGDTIVAIFSLGLACSLSIKDSLKLANKAAGAVVAKRGTALVTLSDIETFNDFNSKLLLRKDLDSLSFKLKKEGKKIVTLNGSFDLLHSGHLHILKEAKEQGDVLILGLNSDQSIKRYKGKFRPFISELERAKMLLSLIYVDYVHIFSEDNPILFLQEVKPDIHVNGSEYGEKCIESKIVKKNNGKLFVVDLIPNLSTTNIVKKIKAS